MIIKEYMCDIGLKREINEDSFLIDENNNYIIVSDGMGGHEKGNIASNIIVNTFEDTFNNFLEFENFSYKKDFQDKIKQYLNIANGNSTKRIIEYAKKNNIKKTIGATVVGMFYDDYFKELVLFNLGDSRIYLIRNNEISQITNDHIVMDKEGKNNILSKAIGNFKSFDMEVSFFDYKKDDIYLICTDGVSDFIKDNEILDVINTNSNNYCDIIRDIVYKNGASDNLTLVISQIG